MRTLFIPINRLLSAVVMTLVTGCQQYDVTLNDKLVYEPKRLFRDYSITDSALAGCVAQAIIDQQVTEAIDLTQLNCSNAGVGSLDGLAIFSRLKGLKLSNNRIRNLVELSNMVQLETVILDKNSIVDPIPLRHMRALALLDLTGNYALQCPQQGEFDHVATLKLPEYCTTL